MMIKEVTQTHLVHRRKRLEENVNFIFEDSRKILKIILIDTKM